MSIILTEGGIALISASQLHLSEHITDAIYSSLSMSTLLNMHIQNACAHNVSLYINTTDQWVHSRSPTMLSVYIIIYIYAGTSIYSNYMHKTEADPSIILRDLI